MKKLPPSNQSVACDCTSIEYAEFPELLFGKLYDGTVVFDATHYLERKGDSTQSLELFTKIWQPQVKIVLDRFEVMHDNFSWTNNSHHKLIHASLALLFLSYVDSNFFAYMLEQMNELMFRGFATSDAYILTEIEKRQINASKN